MLIYCDSSTKEACFIIEGQELTIIPYSEPVTNNVGEYKALIFALERAKMLGAKQVEILTDSQLVVNQVNGVWACRAKHLLPFMIKARELAQELQAIISWIPREESLAGKVLE